MVGLLTFGKRQWEPLDQTMRTIIPPLYDIVDQILPMVEADTEAFEAYVVSKYKTNKLNLHVFSLIQY